MTVNARVYKSRATRFCTAAPNINSSSVPNLLHVTILSPTTLKCLLDFWKICAVSLLKLLGKPNYQLVRFNYVLFMDIFFLTLEHLTYLRFFLIIKSTRCTNFSDLFLEWNSTCFGQFLCLSSGVFHCTHSDGICRKVLLTAVEQDQDGTSWSCSTAVSKPLRHIPSLCVQWKTPDDGQSNCPKHVDFHSKNTFEKLVHLVGFVIRNLSRCTVTWTSNITVIIHILVGNSPFVAQ